MEATIQYHTGSDLSSYLGLDTLAGTVVVNHPGRVFGNERPEIGKIVHEPVSPRKRNKGISKDTIGVINKLVDLSR